MNTDLILLSNLQTDFVRCYWCHVSSAAINLIPFLSPSLSFMTLMVLKTSGPLFCRLSPKLDF